MANVVNDFLLFSFWQYSSRGCSGSSCCIGSRHHQRRLSATTRAPWRSVILAFGHRSHAVR
jgi:hypothetical protein